MRAPWRFACGLILLMRMADAAGPPQMESGAANHVIDVEHFDADLLAREIFRETNDLRTRQGLPALKPNARLDAAASEQAATLALRVHTGHDSPLAHHGDPHARVVEHGLPTGTVGENAATLGARNRATGRNYTYREMAGIIVQAWMDSPGHRANILNPGFRELGCGTRAAYLLRDDPMIYSIQDFYTAAPPVFESSPAVRPGSVNISR